MKQTEAVSADQTAMVVTTIVMTTSALMQVAM